MQIGTEKTVNKNELIERTIRKYADMIYRLAFQYTGNEYDAQDILQEVGISLATSSPPFDDDKHLRNWLCRVTVNKCRNFHKYRKIRACEELDENIAYCDNHHSLREELAMLPSKYRTVLYLYYYDGYSIEEISEILGLSKNTVGTQLRRGREHLKKILCEGD